jgi:hypothetical protein
VRFLGHSECTTKTYISVLSELDLYVFMLYTFRVACILEADKVVYLTNCVLMLCLLLYCIELHICAM